MSGLPTVAVHAIDPQPTASQWLIRDLWSAAAVGVIGGLPKSCKSWFGLDLAVSVASATATLDRFDVLAPGPALVYLAEDSLPAVRDRVAHLCRHRGLDLNTLDLHVVTSASLRLDCERDQLALDRTLTALRCCCSIPSSVCTASTRTQPQTSPLCSASCANSTAAIGWLSSSSTISPSVRGATSAKPCAAPPTCMPGPTPPAIWCAAPTGACCSPSNIAPHPRPIPS